jgi:hypothetical protein
MDYDSSYSPSLDEEYMLVFIVNIVEHWRQTKSRLRRKKNNFEHVFQSFVF